MRTLFVALLTGLAVILPCSTLSSADTFKPEPGFSLLFNGKNLDGWQTKAGESLEGKTEAFKGRFKVADGKLVIDPKVKGDVVIQTSRSLAKDVVIGFEYFPGPGCNNDMFFRGHKFDITKNVTKNLKEGEWNQFEIVSSGDTVEFKSNGETQRTAKVKMGGTPFGLRAEFGPIQYRHIRAKETP